MAFWNLEVGGSRIALVAASGATITYDELRRAADELNEKLPRKPSRGLGFLLFSPNLDAVALYLGALRSRRHVPLLLKPDIHAELLEQLIATYQPDWIADSSEATAVGYTLSHETRDIRLRRRVADMSEVALHDSLGLLLSTSGSTGSQKLVRLSYEAIDANAEAIRQYLRLTERDRALTTLELSYSFGMSILNSHLAAGASIVLTEETLLSRPFWDVARKSHITSLSGVPSQFEMLRRAGWERRGIDSLRMLTQAGGNLSEPVKREFAAISSRLGIEFFVMYGQTEAAPRISYVPPDRLPEKLGSIGIPIPGGSLELGAESSELIYRGPNVMLGYAECRGDLARGDDLNGVLHTGDIGRRDEEGFFYLTGRLKRFIKISGARINLDDIEALLTGAFDTPLACVGVDDRLAVVLCEGAPVTASGVREFLRSRCDIFPGLVEVERRRSLPYMSNGKLDYQALMCLVK